MLLSLLMIIGNTVILACESYYNTPSYNAQLIFLNKMFTVIFTVEMTFKIYALSLMGYVKDGFNLFDGILVVVSLFDWALEAIMGSSSGMGVLTVFRTLRLLRVFKLATRSKGLLILLTVQISLFSFLTPFYRRL